MESSERKHVDSFIGSPLENQSSKSLEAWFLGSKAENQDELESLVL